MKTQLHLGIGESRSFRTLPLGILAWLESTALKMELAPYLKRARESDGWFVCREEQTFGPVPFEKVMRLLLRGEESLPVLHESEVHLEPAPWRVITYHTWALTRFTAALWTVGFWVLTVALGFVVVTLACPVGIRPGVGAAYFIAVVALAVWLSWRSRRAAASAETEPEILPEADAEPLPETE